MIAFQKYINLKDFKILDLLNISKRLETAPLVWAEALKRFKSAVGDYVWKDLTFELKDYKFLKIHF